jgi:hypothetical protein
LGDMNGSVVREAGGRGKIEMNQLIRVSRGTHTFRAHMAGHRSTGNASLARAWRPQANAGP